MTTIIGVDFSGARSDRNTWIARGELGDESTLSLRDVWRIGREDLFDLLLRIPTPAVAALDFPFGLPASFATWVCGGESPAEMPNVWRAVGAAPSLVEFVQARDEFVAAHQVEPKRAGDAAHFPESFSPLHKVNPVMTHMTYHGIQMLNRLRSHDQSRWSVPPLPSPPDPGATVTLLELMPGALLRSLGLPHTGYKGGSGAEQRARRAKRREHIFDAVLEVADAKGCKLTGVDDSLRRSCVADDNCLDALIAALGAAMWAHDPARFRHPTAEELPSASLEGWIYVPEPEPN